MTIPAKGLRKEFRPDHPKVSLRDRPMAFRPVRPIRPVLRLARWDDGDGVG